MCNFLGKTCTDEKDPRDTKLTVMARKYGLIFVAANEVGKPSRCRRNALFAHATEYLKDLASAMLK